MQQFCTLHTNKPGPRLVVGWTGPNSGCFGWLRARIELNHQVITISDENWQMHPLDRWIFASSDRLCLPTRDQQAAGVPLAIATSDWWEGAGRTGLRELQLPAIPWYRWWDGWHDWLDGTCEPLFTPFPPRLAHTLSPPKPDLDLPLGSGWIVANCPQSADGWTLAAQQIGHVVTWYSREQFQRHLENPHLVDHPDWLLWDDTSLDTWNAAFDFAECCHFFRLLQQRLPEVRTLIALTLPLWDQWRDVHRAGAQELIAKPMTAGVLHRSLASPAPNLPL